MEKTIQEVLKKYQSLVVYGLSPDSSKPSHYVPLYMKNHGWQVSGVYPKPFSGDQFQIYKSLSETPAEARKFLNVFRSSDKIPELVEEVLRVGGVEVLWLQLGISHPEAEAKAAAAGIKVVSNRCLMVEHRAR